MSTPSGHGNSTQIADARTLAAELGRRVAARPESEGIAAPYLALLSAQAPVEDAFSPPPMPGTEARDRLARGVPALAPEEFQADHRRLEERCRLGVDGKCASRGL